MEMDRPFCLGASFFLNRRRAGGEKYIHHIIFFVAEFVLRFCRGALEKNNPPKLEGLFFGIALKKLIPMIAAFEIIIFNKMRNKKTNTPEILP